MSNVTQILSQIESGDPSAAEQLLPLVYEELRKLAAAKLAHEKPGRTLQATALVHEAYLRLVDSDESRHWDGRRHFFAAASESMRRILVEQARRKSRLKRGGGWEREDVQFLETKVPDDELLALDEALADFAEEHPDKAELVKLRYFVGMTIPQAADALGISKATADRHWSYAHGFSVNFAMVIRSPRHNSSVARQFDEILILPEFSEAINARKTHIDAEVGLRTYVRTGATG